MDFLADILKQHVELTIFLVLALGFFFGRLRIGSFVLGPMLGCLFAGVLIGQLNIPASPVIKLIFFDLFLFATGYKVGPQFFYGLKKDAFPQLSLTLVICVGSLLAAFAVSKILGYDTGTAAGLLAGAFSESTVIGTAGDAIQKLSIPTEEKTRLLNNIPVAYAVTYLVGTTTNVWFLSSFAPKLMKVNLRKVADELSSSLGKDGYAHFEFKSAYREWTLRALRISGNWNGKTVREIENSIPDARILVERVRKNGEIVEPQPDMKIEENDVIVIAARQKIMLDHLLDKGKEVLDKELLDFPIRSIEITITNREISGKSLKEIAYQYGQGIILNKLLRSGQDLPFEPGTIVNRGDRLYISGREIDVERFCKEVGFKEPKKFETDLIFVGIGIVLGGLVGLISVTIGGVAITLSTSGGALVMGLVFGWLHSRRPKIGFIPEGAIWIFDNLGLAVFLGLIGLAAGPSFISGLAHTGLSIIPAGLVVAILPHVIGLFFGSFILKLNPLILLGAQSGAGTSTTSLKAIQDVSNSKLPVLGYTIPYALGNILLTAWGPVIVSLMNL